MRRSLELGRNGATIFLLENATSHLILGIIRGRESETFHRIDIASSDFSIRVNIHEKTNHATTARSGRRAAVATSSRAASAHEFHSVIRRIDQVRRAEFTEHLEFCLYRLAIILLR